MSSRAWRTIWRCGICEAQLTPPVAHITVISKCVPHRIGESDRRRGRRDCMRHASHPLDRCPGLDLQVTRNDTVLVEELQWIEYKWT